MDSGARLRLVTEAAKLTIDAPIPLPSDSNEVREIGELVVRICHWTPTARLSNARRSSFEQLPNEVLRVRLADSGVIDNLSWMLTHWVPARCCPNAGPT